MTMLKPVKIKVLTGKSKCGHFKCKLEVTFQDGSTGELSSPHCYDTDQDAIESGKTMGEALMNSEFSEIEPGDGFLPHAPMTSTIH